jgi:hypothetical protein
MAIEALYAPQDSRDLPEVAAGLREALEQALAMGGRPVHRLGSAGTSVTFLLAGERDLSATVLLDRHPPEVTNGSEPAEITIELDAEQADDFIAGQLVLPNCIHQGQVLCRGPVRKYLSFDPILRALLYRASRPA